MPVIELNGHVMCESVDCCEYLDKNYNGGRLSHQDKDKNVRDKRLIEKYYKVCLSTANRILHLLFSSVNYELQHKWLPESNFMHESLLQIMF